MPKGKQVRSKKVSPPPKPVDETDASDSDSDESVSSGFLTKTHLEESHADAEPDNSKPPLLSRDPKSASREPSSDSNDEDQPLGVNGPSQSRKKVSRSRSSSTSSYKSGLQARNHDSNPNPPNT